MSKTTPVPEPMKRVLCFAVIAAIFAAHPVSHAADSPEDLAQFPRATIQIEAGGKSQQFEVWVADTPARQGQGLMFVRDLAADSGMLFEYASARVVSMWMKNTYIPLDMLFVDAGGRIARITANTTPHSLQSISSGTAVTAVIELRAGEAERRRLKIGDKVVVSTQIRPKGIP